MSLESDYSTFVLIEEGEAKVFTSGELFKEEVADLILSRSRIELNVREGKESELIVEVL